MLLILQKTTRSLQRHLHSFFEKLLPRGKVSVSPSAYTQARAKLSHTAFLELNRDILVPAFYAPEQKHFARKWHGRRLLGMDGSTLRLPDQPEIAKKFGSVTVPTGDGSTEISYTVVRLCVLFDLLNHLGLDVQVEPQTTGELEMAQRQLELVEADDVVVFDRGFVGFVFLAQIRQREAHFVGRCSRSSFFMATELHRLNRAGRSVVAKVTAPSEQQARLRRLGLPVEMVMRFVSVRLCTGELEVLVTSLLDKEEFPSEELKEVYAGRWDHEGYHLTIKSRLELENWTGQSVESVLQDIHATILVTNLESLFSMEVQEKLNDGREEGKHPLKVNHADGFHALKEKMIALLIDRKRPAEEVIAEIEEWMRHNPVAVRKRKVERRKSSWHNSYRYQRMKKKVVF